MGCVRRFVNCLALLVLIAMSSPASAGHMFGPFECMGQRFCQNVVHVPADASTIQEAIDMVADGGTVLVASGTYVESIVIVGKSVVLRGKNRAMTASGLPLIQARTPGDVVLQVFGGFPTSLVTVDGFAIAGGSTGIRAGKDADVTIRNCDIHGNVGGPGILVESFASVDVVDTSIRQNGAVFSDGGGVRFEPGSSGTMTRCLISRNAAWSGGGVFANTASINFYDCAFQNNTAQSSGGAVRAVESNVTVVGGRYFGNSAVSRGGAISGCGVQMTIDGAVFESNQSEYGGGIFIDSVENNVSITATRLCANFAEYGGGLAVNGWNRTVMLDGVEFSFNEATVNGGAIWANGDTQFLGVQNCVVAGNTAVAGGGIWLSADFGDLSDAVCGSTSFCGNSPDDVVGTWNDQGGNVFTEECARMELLCLQQELPVVPGDFNGDGLVNFDDLIVMLSAWGSCPVGAPCPADVTGDGVVGFEDLVALLSGWS